MVEMSQFPGGRVEVSHLYHAKCCVYLVHLVLEPHARTGNEYIAGSRVYAVGQPPPFIF